MPDADDLFDRIADQIHREARAKAPIDTGAFRRKLITGSVGLPVWLYDLLVDAGYDDYLLAIEVGGRGVLHPDLGWVSIDELRELASREEQEDA